MKKLLIATISVLLVSATPLLAQKKNGVVVEKMNSNEGNFVRTATYINDIPNGAYSEVYEKSGKTKTTGNYIAGKKDGAWDYFKADGLKTNTDIFAAGSVVKKITYFANGAISTERELKNDKGHGVSKKYDQDGTVKSEQYFENGKQNGKSITRVASTTGAYVCTENFVNDKRDGDYVEEYTGGQIKVKGQYKMDKKEGTWTYGNAKGVKTKEEIYVDGKLSKTNTL